MANEAISAHEFACEVDRVLSGEWKRGAVIALRGGTADRAVIVSVEEDIFRALMVVPTMRSVAACVSSLGYATDLRQPATPSNRIRFTLAVSCCLTAAVIRHRDGRVMSAIGDVDGELHDALRGWAELTACTSCEAGIRKPLSG